MDAARVLRESRHRAGLTQAELAERAGVLQPAVARIETGRVRPRVDTLERLLRICGMTLVAERRLGTDVDREMIRHLLAVAPLARLAQRSVPGFRPIRALRVLSARHVDLVVGGAAAARLHGAPVRCDRLEIFPRPDPMNRRRLGGALDRFRSWRIGVGKVVVRWSLSPVGSYELLTRASSPISIDRRVVRVASIDDLITLAGSRRDRAILAAAREE